MKDKKLSPIKISQVKIIAKHQISCRLRTKTD